MACKPTPKGDVAPHTGAWIETLIPQISKTKRKSRPTRARGLKLPSEDPLHLDSVAPHTGAWIETTDKETAGKALDVAPHTGAWIETPQMPIHIILDCRAPHGRVD